MRSFGLEESQLKMRVLAEKFGVGGVLKGS